MICAILSRVPENSKRDVLPLIALLSFAGLMLTPCRFCVAFGLFLRDTHSLENSCDRKYTPFRFLMSI